MRLKFDTSKIEFSRYDIARSIRIPQGMNIKLAELIGILLGDGNLYLREEKKYEIHIDGDLNEDIEYHTKTIVPLFRELFNIEPFIRIKNYSYSKSIRTELSSKAILQFFIRIIKIKPGKKTPNIHIPKCITDTNKEIRYSFLRGLADTDFCLRFKTRYNHKNYYPIIVGNFSSKKFVEQLKLLLEKVGLHSHMEYHRKYDRLRKKIYPVYSVNVVGKKNLKKWMNCISFKNKRHLTKYLVWRKVGFCPPYTNIEERRKILKGGINNSLYRARGPAAK